MNKQITRALMAALITITSVTAQAQTKRVVINEKNIGGLMCKKNMSIDLDKGDTSRYIIILFIDKRYEVLKEYGSLYFNEATDKQDLLQFIKDLKTASAQEEKADISWTRGKYKLTLYDFSTDLYITSDKKEETQVKPKHVKELVEWLESVK